MKVTGYLNEQSVLEIFACRPLRCRKTGGLVQSTSTCRELARRYKVSDNTVRGIWSRRSWVKVTRPFWTAEELGETTPSKISNEDDRSESCTSSQERCPSTVSGTSEDLHWGSVNCDSIAQDCAPPSPWHHVEDGTAGERVQDFLEEFSDRRDFHFFDPFATDFNLSKDSSGLVVATSEEVW
mmetsp:Transcript_45378/g.106553  ORF Transcript_45378/g.106553 Transcript_45378/m.106553 type:complete len:182 (+) Transcript_45378:94-639(+)